MRIQVFKANEKGLRAVLVLPSLRAHKSPILIDGLARADLRSWVEETIKTIQQPPAPRPN